MVINAEGTTGWQEIRSIKNTCADLKTDAKRQAFAAEEASEAYLHQPRSKTEHEALQLARELCRASHNRLYELYGRVQLDLEYPRMRTIPTSNTPSG